MERRNRIRTKLIVTFIALVTGLVVLSAMIWYRVATGHVRREMENRLQAVAQAGGIVLNDPGLIQALVADLGPNTRAIAQDELERIRDRFGVDAAYIFDHELRIRATTDTTRMDVGSIYPALENYPDEIERALAGEAVITVPFRDTEGNVYQTAMAPLVGFVDARGTRREIVAVLGVDLPVEFLDVFHDFRRMTVLLTALAIGLTILVGFFFARSLSRPIGELVRSAERMERGEMAEPVAIESRDEIGFLGDALENMRQQGNHPVIEVRTELAGDRVRLSVSDNGGGFPEELMARIFEPYVSSKPRGTGLGLAIVKKIVDEHHGSIAIENRPSRGASVSVLLPLAKAA